MTAPNEIIEGEVVSVEKPVAASNETKTVKKASRPKKTKLQSKTSPGEGSAIPSWRHDSGKWGTPKQTWKTSQKAIWLLYVVGQELSIDELTINQIVETFNTQFKQSGMLYSRHIGRDLGRLKITKNAPVSENTTVSPVTWFLTQAGIKHATDLVIEGRGESSPNSSES